tara:strand:- start:2194 stop:2400 length:207 start_codon:yes stop_codon:yes gene_type:complete
MEFYTLLTIVYPIAEHELQFSVWFASENECWNILTKQNTIYDKLNAISGHCDVSEVASKIVKPKLRPW